MHEQLFGTLASATVPLGALAVGVWADDPVADRIHGDAVTAGILGLPEVEAAEGVTRARLTSIFHPDDFARSTDERRRVRNEGGLFVWEHRIVPTPGVVRWVLARGRFVHDSDGALRGRGILIDTTESRAAGARQTLPVMMTALGPPASPLSLLADQAIELWETALRLDAAPAVRIRSLLRPLLFEIGRQLASGSAERARRTGDPPGC